ncbi:hypothetical protein BO71DRAFT_123091 [Aspergillus ellipticus CBS 707.79]|uniref:Uncharacterized protein n=1 Tax=Aspergillus ellipticus CBS 707.79 TaxID=1448320 RepID=A0A319DD54_9EURO|nr:hypothetical protein BO71DRAFT_123091 [Aspergillus ellipticus CBS 707.79]
MQVSALAGVLSRRVYLSSAGLCRCLRIGRNLPSSDELRPDVCSDFPDFPDVSGYLRASWGCLWLCTIPSLIILFHEIYSTLEGGNWFLPNGQRCGKECRRLFLLPVPAALIPRSGPSPLPCSRGYGQGCRIRLDARPQIRVFQAMRNLAENTRPRTPCLPSIP